MDEKPECSRDLVPKTSHKSVDDDQPTNSQDQLTALHPNLLTQDETIILMHETPSINMMKEQLAISLEQPRRSQIDTLKEIHLPKADTGQIVPTPVPKEESIVFRDQPNLPKYQALPSRQQTVAMPGNSNALTKDETIILMNENPSINSNEQPVVSLDHPSRSQIETVEETHIPKEDTGQIMPTPVPKEESLVLRDQPNLPKYQALPSCHQTTTMIGSSNALTNDETIILMNENPSIISNEQPTVSTDEPRRSQIETPKEIHLPKPDTGQMMPTAAPKEEPVLIRDQPNLPKYQALPSRHQTVATLGNSSGHRAPENMDSGMPFCIARAASSTLSYSRNNSYLNSYGPLTIRSSTQGPITTQPHLTQIPASVTVTAQPPTLFLQALSKLKESSLTLSVLSNLKLLQSTTNGKRVNIDSGDITPPDSLTSAPPSYSFVLRQMAVRRRPRFMGTFFPSPSFVLHTPPPTYTTAFDVYIEPALPPPPRVYTFGFSSMPIVCPECGYTGMTVVTSRITICTHLCAFILCLLCCWICAPLPYILRSCKDVYHYCRNCRSFLGMYCPTNPESVYP